MNTVPPVMSKWQRFRSGIVALFDQTAWLMITPVTIALWFIDPALVKTTIQWSLMASIFLGITVILSRVAFPAVRLGHLMEKAEAGELPAAIVAGAQIIAVTIIFFAIAIWSKP